MTKARTLADNFAADINAVTANAPLTGGGTSGTVTVGIQAGTTAQSGAVQLTDSTTSTSTTTAATPNSVKSAYDLADAAIAKSIVDAKADLITATADNTPARLAVGSNGDTLVADSSATTGLRWQGDWNTGKNKIINGDFRINQRGFSSTTTHAAFGHDRWRMFVSGAGTLTYSTQAFTAGSAPVAGYEGVNYARLVTSGQTLSSNYSILTQPIEDGRTFAGQTVTVSFWARANSGTPSIAVIFDRSYGTGGSPSAAEYATTAQKTAITTSWARYSLTFNISSVSGKTFGTDLNSSSLSLYLWTSAGTNWNTDTNSLGIQNNTIDIWGVQVEAGSVATPFTTATGTLAGELAACQRYYYLHSTGANKTIALGAAFTSGEVDAYVPFKVSMRTAPTLVASSGTNYYNFNRNSGTDSFNSWIIYNAHETGCQIYNNTEISSTAGQAGIVENANASASVAFSAEL